MPLSDWKNWSWKKCIDQMRRFTENPQNLIALCVVLAGLFIGSLLVDAGQLMTGSGFSSPAIQKHDVLVAGGKTWVSYTEPRVAVQVVSDRACAECDPAKALLWLRRIVPTIEAERIDIESEAGQKLAQDFQLVSLPAFIFAAPVAETEFFSQAEPLFRKEGKRYVFDMSKIGMPVGRYLIAPSLGENDIVLGSKDAPVTLTIFSDFQCQYCKDYHASYKQLLNEYGDRIRVVYKHLPLPAHPFAEKAAEAAQCAAAQDRFIPYADILFEKQAEWGRVKAENRFQEYAWRIPGMDGRAFGRCLTEGVSADKVAQDFQLAQDFNIEATPASFIGREFVSGAIPYTDLKKLVEAALNN